MAGNTINQRLLLLIKKKELNVNSFSKRCGLQSQVVHNIVGGRLTKPSFDVLQKILSTFDDIDPNWLIHGVENKSASIVEEEKGSYKKSKKTNEGIPLINIEAFAGISNMTEYSVNFETIQERYVIPLFDNKQVDFLIYVRGSSMYPKYSSGDVVACKFISDRLYIQWNKVYVVDTDSQGTMIKRLKKSDQKGYITFRSDNKEYDDFDVPENDIRNIALVVGVIRLE